MEPSAAEIIIAEHHHIREIFDQYDRTNSRTERSQLVAGALEGLSAHTRVVEDVFLPKIADRIKRPDLLEEAHKDNHTMVALIEKLRGLEPGSEHIDPTFRLIEETMRAHMEVEESLILPLAKQLGVDMEQLGKEMQQDGSPVDAGDERLAGFGY